VPADFTSDDLARLERLARIELTEEERVLFGRQLASILAYAEQVREIDTSGVPPTSHPLGTPAPMRRDETRPSLPRDEVLTQAPEADLHAGLFKVPRVLG
jgi:aspartyl-tRNA(Asn)/glutamyl-tRNA(Gln) amidotransferase subunit C